MTSSSNPDEIRRELAQQGIEVLCRDPAVLAADPDTRKWLLALLEHGERSSSATHGEPGRRQQKQVAKMPGGKNP
jgi:hypothetical protein